MTVSVYNAAERIRQIEAERDANAAIMKAAHAKVIDEAMDALWQAFKKDKPRARKKRSEKEYVTHFGRERCEEIIAPHQQEANELKAKDKDLALKLVWEARGLAEECPLKPSGAIWRKAPSPFLSMHYRPSESRHRAHLDSVWVRNHGLEAKTIVKPAKDYGAGCSYWRTVITRVDEDTLTVLRYKPPFSVEELVRYSVAMGYNPRTIEPAITYDYVKAIREADEGKVVQWTM